MALDGITQCVACGEGGGKASTAANKKHSTADAQKQRGSITDLPFCP